MVGQRRSPPANGVNNERLLRHDGFKTPVYSKHLPSLRSQAAINTAGQAAIYIAEPYTVQLMSERGNDRNLHSPGCKCLNSCGQELVPCASILETE
jgi:hypothetical protein